MANIDTPDRFTSAIIQALETETRKAIEEEAEKAADAVRRRVRESVGRISMSILTQFDVERCGQDIVIRVRNATDGQR